MTEFVFFLFFWKEGQKKNKVKWRKLLIAIFSASIFRVVLIKMLVYAKKMLGSMNEIF